MRILVKEERVRPKFLFEASDIPSSSFYDMMNHLAVYDIVRKTVRKDRSVYYSITPFGRTLWESSRQLEKGLHKQWIRELRADGKTVGMLRQDRKLLGQIRRAMTMGKR